MSTPNAIRYGELVRARGWLERQRELHRQNTRLQESAVPGYCDALLELIDRELYQMHQPDRRERIGLFILVALAAGGGIAVIVWFIKAVVMAAQWGVK